MILIEEDTFQAYKFDLINQVINFSLLLKAQSNYVIITKFYMTFMVDLVLTYKEQSSPKSTWFCFIQKEGTLFFMLQKV